MATRHPSYTLSREENPLRPRLACLWLLAGALLVDLKPSLHARSFNNISPARISSAMEFKTGGRDVERLRGGRDFSEYYSRWDDVKVSDDEKSEKPVKNPSVSVRLKLPETFRLDRNQREEFRESVKNKDLKTATRLAYRPEMVADILRGDHELEMLVASHPILMAALNHTTHMMKKEGLLELNNEVIDQANEKLKLMAYRQMDHLRIKTSEIQGLWIVHLLDNNKLSMGHYAINLWCDDCIVTGNGVLEGYYVNITGEFDGKRLVARYCQDGVRLRTTIVAEYNDRNQSFFGEWNEPQMHGGKGSGLFRGEKKMFGSVGSNRRGYIKLTKGDERLLPQLEVIQKRAIYIDKRAEEISRREAALYMISKSFNLSARRWEEAWEAALDKIDANDQAPTSEYFIDAARTLEVDARREAVDRRLKEMAAIKLSLQNDKKVAEKKLKEAEAELRRVQQYKQILNRRERDIQRREKINEMRETEGKQTAELQRLGPNKGLWDFERWMETLPSDEQKAMRAFVQGETPTLEDLVLIDYRDLLDFPIPPSLAQRLWASIGRVADPYKA